MSNYICRSTQFSTPERDVINILVPTSHTFHAGQVIMVKNLVAAGTLAGNHSVWEAVEAATADLGLQAALIINGGDFEQLADGRRPEGNPDYTSSGYAYNAGDVAPAIILELNNEFELSADVVGGTPTVGQYLEPADGQAYLQVKGSRTSGVTSALKVLALKNFRSGGNFGGSFISTYVARVVA